MADDDDGEGGDERVGEDEDGEDALWYWERHAINRVRTVLETAELDEATGTITLRADEWDPTGKGRYDERTFRTEDGVRSALVELADQEWIGNVPWENGPVFTFDADSIVETEMDDAQIFDFFAKVRAAEEGELLISLEDVSEPDAGETVRLEFEEVNDLLIGYLAEHPKLMMEFDSRRFEEVVAELFRRMGYEVVLTPRSKEGST